MEAIAGYLSSVDETFLLCIQDYRCFHSSDGEQSSVSKSSLQHNHFRSKPLHGQFLRDVQEEN